MSLRCLLASFVIALLTLLTVVTAENADKTGSLGHGTRELASEDLDLPVQQRCAATIGDWCNKHFTNITVALWKPRVAPHVRPCTQNCNNVGTCNYDLGICSCPAGWKGSSCETVQKRPCTNRFRNHGPNVVGHIDENGRDLDWHAEGFTESRCLGVCDDVIGRCYCDGTFRFVPAPASAAPGSPPLSWGRPLGNHLCQPNECHCVASALLTARNEHRGCVPCLAGGEGMPWSHL